MKYRAFAIFILGFPTLVSASCPEDSALLLRILGKNDKTKVEYECKIGLRSEVEFGSTGIRCSLSEIQKNPHREKIKLPDYYRVVYSCGNLTLKIEGELGRIDGGTGLITEPAVFTLKEQSQPNKSWSVFVGCAGLTQTANIKLCDPKESGLAL
jgi:hypothetical protein